MKNSIHSLWNEKQRLELFGKIDPNLSERAEVCYHIGTTLLAKQP